MHGIIYFINRSLILTSIIEQNVYNYHKSRQMNEKVKSTHNQHTRIEINDCSLTSKFGHRENVLLQLRTYCLGKQSCATDLSVHMLVLQISLHDNVSIGTPPEPFVCVEPLSR